MSNQNLLLGFRTVILWTNIVTTENESLIEKYGVKFAWCRVVLIVQAYLNSQITMGTWCTDE